MFEEKGCTIRARRVMALANEEAKRMNHESVDTEHLLLGLLKEGSGLAANVLTNLDLTLQKLRFEVAKLLGRGCQRSEQLANLPLAPRSKQVIDYAYLEAKSLRHSHVDTEHLLLGLLRVEGGLAVQILKSLGLEPGPIREEVLGLLGLPEESGRLEKA